MDTATQKLFAASDEHAARAHGRTPSTAANALLAGPVTVGEVVLQPVVLGHIVLLDAIDHPVMTGRPWKIADVVAVAFLLARTEDAREAFAAGKFGEAAWQWSLQFPAHACFDLGAAARQLLARAFDPIIATPKAEGEANDPLARSQPPRQGSAGLSS